jgi:drug/metabolite transporter (DMT)-like permease
MERRAAAAGPLLAAAFWGGMYVVSKWGFGSIPPVTLSTLRIALGAATLLVVVRATRPSRSFSTDEWLRFAGLGALVAVTIVAQFVGTDLTTASQGSLLTVLTPVFTVLLGVSLLGERLTRRATVGMGLAVAGTVVVVAGQYDLSAVDGGSAAGVALLLVGSLGWAAYTVLGKPLIRRYSALEAATYSSAFAVPATALLLPAEFALSDASLAALRVTPAVVAAVVYLGVVSTAAAWYCWYKGLEYADASTVAAFFFAQPVVGAALGVLLLGESVGPGLLGGGAVMAVGVYLVSTAE